MYLREVNEKLYKGNRSSLMYIKYDEWKKQRFKVKEVLIEHNIFIAMIRETKHLER